MPEPEIRYENQIWPSAVWLWDQSLPGYVDLTLAMRKGTASPLIAESTDFLYIGLKSKHEMLLWTLSVSGSYTGLKYEYSENDDTWTEFVPAVSPKSDGTNFALNDANGEWLYYDLLYSNWDMKQVPSVVVGITTYAPPDTNARYWIRVSASTITTVATATGLAILPCFYYTTPERVSMEITGNYDLSADFKNLIETKIPVIQDRIDSDTHKSWRPRLIIDEAHDYNLYGLRLMLRPIRRIAYVQLWQDGWLTLIPGRGMSDGQYFYDQSRGLLCFTGNLWYPWGHMRYRLRKFPAYQLALKITYVGGNFLETMYSSGIRMDRQMEVIRQLATQLTAIEVIASHDYTKILPEGLSSLQLADKSERWHRWTSETLDNLCELSMF